MSNRSEVREELNGLIFEMEEDQEMAKNFAYEVFESEYYLDDYYTVAEQAYEISLALKDRIEKAKNGSG